MKNGPVYDDLHDYKILDEIVEERERQHKKFGEQNWNDGTGGQIARMMADTARERCDAAFKDGKGVWKDILTEEFREAMAESDPVKLREELVQCAAVCVAWVAAIDRRMDNSKK